MRFIDILIEDFKKIADEVVVDVNSNSYQCAINRSTSKYVELAQLLKKDETLCQLWILDNNQLRKNDKITVQNTNEEITLLDRVECIDSAISNWVGILKRNSELRSY